MGVNRANIGGSCENGGRKSQCSNCRSERIAEGCVQGQARCRSHV